MSDDADTYLSFCESVGIDSASPEAQARFAASTKRLREAGLLVDPEAPPERLDPRSAEGRAFICAELERFNAAVRERCPGVLFALVVGYDAREVLCTHPYELGEELGILNDALLASLERDGASYTIQFLREPHAFTPPYHDGQNPEDLRPASPTVADLAAPIDAAVERLQNSPVGDVDLLRHGLPTETQINPRRGREQDPQ